MAIYSAEAINEVLNAVDIVDIVNDYVSLRRQGRNFTGLCPFHREKTPSFVVSPDKQIYKCFGCSEGGNAIHFIMKVENLDFKDALEFLAERCGIDLTRFIVNNSFSSIDDKNKKDRLYKLNMDSVEYFYAQLLEKQAIVAQEYVKRRKIDMRMLKEFKIGYGGSKEFYGNNENTLYSFLRAKGYTEDEMLMSGLMGKSDKGNIYERFRGRLIFPICDIRDKVIAFGGRVLDDSLPKYVNSPETTIYSKGKNLYAMNVAKKQKMENLIVVEGYMDALSLHKAGVSNAVASLGTALTESQGRLIRKYTSDVIICYDTDSAGQAATIRGMDILTSLGLNVKILRLEGAKDPDEYINKYGTERFLVAAHNAISLVEYKVGLLNNTMKPDSTDGKIKFLNEMAKILSKVENNIERDVYIDNIAKEYNMSTGPIISEINRISARDDKKEKEENIKIETVVMERTIEKEKQQNISINDKQDNLRYETIVAILMLKDKKAFELIKANQEYIQINDEILYNIYEYVISLYENQSIYNIDILSSVEDDKMINKMTSIMQIEIDGEKKIEVLSSVLNILKKYKLKEDIRLLRMKFINKGKYTAKEASELERELFEKTRFLSGLK